ncbi:MAG: imidazolonepropionase [Bacteroidia bacterium]
MKLLLKNIKELVQVEDSPVQKANETRLSTLPFIKNAYIIIKDDLIFEYGEMQNELNDDFNDVIDCTGKIVLPCWCDSHTHIVFAGSRESEFVDRINGLSYEEIAHRGGGILNSAKKLHETSEEHLYETAWFRLQEIIKGGTGAVEIKSGYGLSLEDELKMLRVIKKLKKIAPVAIKSTFLGAHALPLEYKNSRQDYVKLITDKMLPAIAKDDLADYCDVFCDRGFFTPDETDIILKRALEFGLKPKIHANELDYSGGIQVGVANNAVSVDHLEFTGDEEIRVLKKSNTIPTLLPSTAFFLGLHYPPARKMIDAGLPVALATDYNPGSSPSGNMSFVLSLACIKMKMTPEEAINAATINGAAAMELSEMYGSISIGKKANIIITQSIPSIAYIPYSFGTNKIEKVIINGKIQN